MKAPQSNTIIAILIIGFFVLPMILFTVDQGQRALVIRLGDIHTQIDSKGQQEAVSYAPGLHARWPLIDSLRHFDVRLQSFEEQSSRILTKEQKYVLVDYYVKWRIEDIALFYTRTGGVQGKAERLLKQKINDALRAEFGDHTISEVISGERSNIIHLLQTKANRSAESLGIQVIDVRVKRIDLPKEVGASVFERMRAERQRVATKHRANGRAQGERIRASADAQALVIVAIAKAKAADIKAQGIKIAAKTYNDAYTKSPEFYSKLRSLESYQQSFTDKRDVLLLSMKDLAYFKYFKRYE